MLRSWYSKKNKLQKRCDLQLHLSVSQATSSSMIISKQELKIRKKNMRSEEMSNILKSSKRTAGKVLIT